jgi:hypothetical protein
MVDQEVVDVLAEIKHRITAAEKPTPVQNGSVIPDTIQRRNSQDSSNNYSSLVVLARAWDRLPPVVSNRSGATANIELWLKRVLRRALRWITWEQVNFNAATHQTFTELIETLNATNQKLVAVEHKLASVTGELHAIQAEHGLLMDGDKKLRLELSSQHEKLESLRTDILGQQALLNNQKAIITEQQASFNALLEEQKAHSSELHQRLAELATEIRERDEKLLDEQRVCFKQLSLEVTESNVLQDRTRREIDARVSKLEDKATN